jgi:uncharacterized repeat protein (TIGR01451 family)
VQEVKEEQRSTSQRRQGRFEVISLGRRTSGSQSSHALEVPETNRKIWRGKATAAAVAAIAATLFVAAAAAQAATPAPAFSISSSALPSHFPLGDATGTAVYSITVKNIGGAATDGTPITIADSLPAGLSLHTGTANVPLELIWNGGPKDESLCAPGPPVSCATLTTVSTGGGVLFEGGVPPVLRPGDELSMVVPLDVASLPDPTTLTNDVTVSGGGAAPVSATEDTAVSADPVAFGLQSSAFSLTDSAGGTATQAGSHPYQLNTSFLLNSKIVNGTLAPVGSLRDVHAALPPGLVIDPQAAPVRCTEAQFETSVHGDGTDIPSCPDASQVGIVRLRALVLGSAAGTFDVPVYNLVPPPGAPAELGFYDSLLNVFVHLRGGLDSAGDYELTADATQLLEASALSVDLDLWGSPSDPSHDSRRGACSTQVDGNNIQQCPLSPRSDTPFLTMPSACSGPLSADLSADSYDQPGDFATASPQTLDSAGNPVGVSGCSTLAFDPTLTAQPTTAQADSPTGLDVDLQVPQTNSMDSLATANLKKTVVDLPAGMAVNPSAADGLGACSPSQIGLTTPIGTSPAHFTAAPDTCPDSAKVGDVSITTPLLPDPLQGSVYLAQQDHNPFPNPSLLALYITIKDPATGVVIKLPGQVTPDPVTGQLHASFDDTPELPFSDFELHFKSGNRATLVTPPSCGTYTTTSKFAPWSAADPDNPTPAEIRTSTDSFQVTSGPGGGPCPDYTDPARFTPTFSAGTVTPQAGGSSPFVLKITKPDGEQQIKQIHVDLPPGLVANLRGVPRCAQSQIQSGVGGHANCPAGSQIGIVNAGAGAGGTPFFLTNQPVYLTDGYAGAPYGIAIDTNLIAGPFNLGHLVVRSTLNVDQDDAQVHIDSEQLPSIIKGIPLHVRSIAVDVNKPGFMLNPTNCNPQTVTGSVTGGGADFNAPGDDTVKPVSVPFQVSGCGSLGFSPHLSGTILNGTQGIHRSDHPNLQFNLGYTLGDANLAAVSVLLPQSLQIDQANLGNICSETQLATQECAGRNPVGTASATTPILASTLSGPVYAVSGSGGLPKLAVILHGPPADPVKLLVRGITSTVGARILNTFPLVPDAPVSNFQLTLNGGPTGYLVNNTNVCAGAKGKSKKAHKKAARLRRSNLTADAQFTAQDGDTLSQQVPIAAQCPKSGKKGKKSAHRKRH